MVPSVGSEMDPSELREVVLDTTVNLLRLAETELPADAVEAIRKALTKESSDVAKAQLDAISRNLEVAGEGKIPMCQDTGTIIFYADVGSDFPLLSDLREILTEGTKRATEEVPLRPNAVNPFTGENSGDNTGNMIPFVNIDIGKGDTLRLSVLPKGGGSENTCSLKMLKPGEGIAGVKKAVIETVVEAGAKPCPPIILGVGVGGGADISLKLAKKALLRPIDNRHPDPQVAALESELLTLTNELGIGAMGLGGDTTVLGVNVEYAHRHPASLPVGIAIQCWAARRATAEISVDGKVTYLTHTAPEGAEQ